MSPPTGQVGNSRDPKSYEMLMIDDFKKTSEIKRVSVCFPQKVQPVQPIQKESCDLSSSSQRSYSFTCTGSTESRSIKRWLFSFFSCCHQKMLLFFYFTFYFFLLLLYNNHIYEKAWLIYFLIITLKSELSKEAEIQTECGCSLLPFQLKSVM